MVDLNRVRRSRKVAHWAGVVIGIGAGLVYLSFSLHIFFGEPGPVNWLGFTRVVARFLTQFLLLPISVMGAFKPRLAAYAVAISFSVTAVLSLAHILLAQYVSISGLASFSLYWIVVPWAIAGLLFYASGQNGNPMPALGDKC